MYVCYMDISCALLINLAQSTAHVQRLSAAQTLDLRLPRRGLPPRPPYIYRRLFKVSITLKGMYDVIQAALAANG